MIARPKISRNERKMTEIGAFEVGKFAPFAAQVLEYWRAPETRGGVDDEGNVAKIQETAADLPTDVVTFKRKVDTDLCAG
ncbi:hypothetical protein JL720_16164 [Aureococcus anophagefferens]|nr:hypothetical protein JL720_16164 [Aureococcus anophagefferens]